MKATKLLEQQHREVEELFERIAEGNVELLSDLADNVAAHMVSEQASFYPAVRGVAPVEIVESLEAHALVELAVKRLLELDADDESFHARLSVARQLIEKHVAEEETELFPAVEAALSPDAQTALGKQLQVRFEEALRRGHEALWPEGSVVTSADLANEVGEAHGSYDDEDDARDDEITRPQNP